MTDPTNMPLSDEVIDMIAKGIIAEFLRTAPSAEIDMVEEQLSLAVRWRGAQVPSPLTPLQSKEITRAVRARTVRIAAGLIIDNHLEITNG